MLVVRTTAVREGINFVINMVFSRGYAKRRNDYCCGSEYANLPLTQM